VRLFQVKTKAGRYTWLQVLSLVISAVAYLLQSSLVMLVMVVLAMAFGILAAAARRQEMKTMVRPMPRGRPRK
jgi:lipopolysaccharide export LptBFGC system permease protein LptF